MTRSLTHFLCWFPVVTLLIAGQVQAGNSLGQMEFPVQGSTSDRDEAEFFAPVVTWDAWNQPPQVEAETPRTFPMFPSWDFGGSSPPQSPVLFGGRRRSNLFAPDSPLVSDDGLAQPSFASRVRRHAMVFGDSPTAGLSLVVDDGLIASSDAPLGGGVRRLRVAANNRALPMDRVIFSHQTYANALTADASNFNVGPDRRTIDLQHYTVGFEKTFFDGMASIDIRSSFANQLLLNTPNFGVEGGTNGNLNVKLKVLMAADDNAAWSAGLGVELPTGSDVLFQGNGWIYELRNDAWFLQPFVAYEERFNRWFVNGFVSMDIALNGNELRRPLIGFSPLSSLGQVRDQALLIANAGFGRWIWENESGTRALAGLMELHYATTLEETDIVQDSVLFQTVSVLNRANRSDTLNLTLGGHLQWGNLQLRGAYVTPLRTGTDRTFSHEGVFQANWLF